MTAQFSELWSIFGEILHVDPLRAALWWLSAIVFACGLVYAWRRLIGS
jgi:formate hydrogenlyase subunit 3/multisubunit Na+/H+ antiporter MnhD subunit